MLVQAAQWGIFAKFQISNLRKMIGCVPQERQWITFPSMVGCDDRALRAPRVMEAPRKKTEIVERLLKMVEISHLADGPLVIYLEVNRAGSYRSGTAKKPSVLLLDEPATSLDWRSRSKY